MPTPTLQTLVTDAQQVLNLTSISAIRSVVAVSLANANTGTPLNPNLTTQQLWDQFYQVVTQPKSDIESIIANQLMKFLYAPPAPGGVGANGQVIFNDAGTLAGAANLYWNKVQQRLGLGTSTPNYTLDVVGSGYLTGNFTITGDLTVKTNVLKVDSANNRVGIGTASPVQALDVRVSPSSGGASGLTVGTGTYEGAIFITGSSYNNYGVGANTAWIYSAANNVAVGPYGAAAVQFVTNGSERARIDSSGNLGLGVTPSALNSSYRGIQIGGGAFLFNNITGASNSFLYTNAFQDAANNTVYRANGRASGYLQLNGEHRWYYDAGTQVAGASCVFTQAMTLDASGNLLVGTTSMPSGVTLARLVAKSTSGDWSGVIWNSNATPYGLRIQHDTDSNGTGNEFLYCLGAANLRASIRSNGGIANYQANDVSLSDSRMKSDIKPLGSYWNKIKSLEIVTFKYKDQTHSDDNIGLIAQQVESVAPELVDVDGFGKTPEDGVPLKTIYTTDLYHAAIKALQEAMARIEVLESKLA